jgi:hypothetical protein
MKAVNYIAKAAVVAVMAFGLGACGKKNNGSAAAAPVGSCTYNGYQYVDANGAQCSATGQTLCPANGMWVNQLGQQQACTPGQYINSYPNPGGYPWQYTPNPATASNCQIYTMQYGVPYVPMVLQGQFVCVRYDLLQQQQNYSYNNFGSYYDYGYDYYYAYPPYSCSNGGGIGINFGGDWGYVNVGFGGGGGCY